MNRLAGSVFLLLCLFVSTLVLAPSAPAQDTMHLERRAAASATGIVNGSVVAVTSVELDGMPLTVHEIAVSSVLSGDVADTIHVFIPGGARSDGGIMMVSTSAAFLAVDDVVQVALRPASDAVSSAIALALGGAAPVFSIAGAQQGVVSLSPAGLVIDRGSSDFNFNGNARPSFSPPARYKINPSNSGLSRAATIKAVRAAFDRWEDDAASVVDFSYAGTTRQVGFNDAFGNNVIDVYWEDPDDVEYLDEETLGATLWVRGDGPNWEFDIVMSTGFQWAVGSPFAVDIESVMAHEVGHGLGLGHPPEAPSEIMFALLGNGIKELGLGDRNGAFQLYPDPNPVTEPGHSVDTNVDGDVVTVSLKANGVLWARRDLGSGWSPWEDLGAGGWASADVTISPFGTVQVAAIKKDGRLFTQRWTTGGNWTGWVAHGSGWDPETTPSISSNSSRTFLGAVSASGALRTKVYAGSWSGATSHGASTWSHVDVDIAADGDLWFAGTKTDGRLLLRKHLGSSWSGFGSMGAPSWSTETPPAIAARSNGVVVAAVKSEGRFYTREQVNGSWRVFKRHGVVSWSSVDIAMTEQGVTWLAASKTYGRLYTRTQTASGIWGAWEQQGADTWSPHADPSISIGAGNRPTLFAVKADHRLYYRPRGASSWAGWAGIGIGHWASGL